MKNNGNFILFCFAVLVSLLTGCKDGFEAFEGSGKTVTVIRPVAPFHSVSVNNNINLVIAYDSVCTLKVEGGKNWLDDILTEVNNQELILKNNNNFLWLKDPGKQITVYITVPFLSSIYYRGVGWIHTTDTLHADQLTVEALDGAGSINLVVNAKTVNLKSLKGAIDIEAKGKTDYLYIFNDAVAPILCKDLVSRRVLVIARGTNDCYINVENDLEARISGVGNVFYRGNPDTIVTSIIGSGNLIKL